MHVQREIQMLWVGAAAAPHDEHDQHREQRHHGEQDIRQPVDHLLLELQLLRGGRHVERHVDALDLGGRPGGGSGFPPVQQRVMRAADGERGERRDAAD
jgi:hypothetical protein